MRHYIYDGHYKGARKEAIGTEMHTAQTSVYLNQRDREILADLMGRTGLRRSEVFRMALQRLHEDGVERHARLIEIAEEIRRLA